MKSSSPKAIAFGGSIGAIDALIEILPKLPSTFALPVMVVLHISRDAPSLLVDLFSERCAMRVREPDDKEPVQGGVIYFAPPNYHVLVEQEHVFSLSNEDHVNYCRPSINLLFESAADAYERDLIGIILTGSNQDGSTGLKRIADKGGYTVVAQSDDAIMSVMPAAALNACPQAQIMCNSEIVELLMECA
jgi:two-component system chemotaxis response regulator CheB